MFGGGQQIAQAILIIPRQTCTCNITLQLTSLSGDWNKNTQPTLGGQASRDEVAHIPLYIPLVKSVAAWKAASWNTVCGTDSWINHNTRMG